MTLVTCCTPARFQKSFSVIKLQCGRAIMCHSAWGKKACRFRIEPRLCFRINSQEHFSAISRYDSALWCFIYLPLVRVSQCSASFYTNMKLRSHSAFSVLLSQLLISCFFTSTLKKIQELPASASQSELCSVAIAATLTAEAAGGSLVY